MIYVIKMAIQTIDCGPLSTCCGLLTI